MFRRFAAPRLALSRAPALLATYRCASTATAATGAAAGGKTASGEQEVQVKVNTTRSTAKMQMRRKQANTLFTTTPRIDFRHQDDDPAQGWFLRVSYVDGMVQLLRVQQSEKPAKDAVTRKIFNGDQVTIFLPQVFIARVLGVLEGSIEKCDIPTRCNMAVFAAGSAPNTFVLTCEPVNISPDGIITPPATAPTPATKWTIEFDVGDGILLQRFFSQALHYCQGFFANSHTPQ